MADGAKQIVIHTVKTREEAGVVAELAREIWTEHYVPIIGEAQVDYMLMKFQSRDAIIRKIQDDAEYFLASFNGAPAGYMATVHHQKERSMMLSKIYVLAAGRRHGIGKAMMLHAEGIARERRIVSLWLTVNRNNSDSVAWYEHMGFRKSREIVQDIGSGFVMDDYRMEKDLTSSCGTEV